MLLRTKKTFRELINKALGYHKNFNLNKKSLIDIAFQDLAPRPDSFADLGGVWGIDGAYTFYALEKYNTTSAFLIDTNFTESVKEKSRDYENLTLISGNFGEKNILEQVNKADAIFLFDVLVHQVAPDWDEILEMYSRVTNRFVIYNQQFVGSEKTVRLLDLGEEEYLKNVPKQIDQSMYRDLFDKMHEVHPEHGRIWRDIHNVWQWGITDNDLCAKMEKLGFILKYRKNYGRFGYLKNFQDHGFIFQKDRKTG